MAGAPGDGPHMPGRRGDVLAQDGAAQGGVAVLPPRRRPGPVSRPVLTGANLDAFAAAVAG